MLNEYGWEERKKETEIDVCKINDIYPKSQPVDIERMKCQMLTFYFIIWSITCVEHKEKLNPSGNAIQRKCIYSRVELLCFQLLENFVREKR